MDNAVEEEVEVVYGKDEDDEGIDGLVSSDVMESRSCRIVRKSLLVGDWTRIPNASAV
jgi:hypothetical protein